MSVRPVSPAAPIRRAAPALTLALVFALLLAGCGGNDGGRLGAATVVVQRVTVRSSGLQDRWGSVSPYTETVGSGEAVVLRDGKAYEGRWRREKAADGTEFTTPDGEPLAFARGPVWVVYAAR